MKVRATTPRRPVNHGTEPTRADHPLSDAAPLREIPPVVLASLGPYDIARLLRTYLEPPGFADAVRRLAEDHLLVLTGEEAVGKRLGAIALLSRMSLAEGSVTVLTPVTTVVELATRMEFEPGRAYLLPDWAGDGADRHDLLKLAGELAAVGCFLVMTRNGAPTPTAEVEQPWEPPASAELFDLCVAGFGGAASRSGPELAEAREHAVTLSTPVAVVDLARQVVHQETPMATLLARAITGPRRR